ncbi:hypothetical protein XAP6164_2490018 [Xanthomonas phaseoli pv. phaseoli]|nr:hypothetical protein XAP6164_2490018 [Xanthomonas phaseoli pv. phaseoli]
MIHAAKQASLTSIAAARVHELLVVCSHAPLSRVSGGARRRHPSFERLPSHAGEGKTVGQGGIALCSRVFLPAAGQGRCEHVCASPASDTYPVNSGAVPSAFHDT